MSMLQDEEDDFVETMTTMTITMLMDEINEINEDVNSGSKMGGDENITSDNIKCHNIQSSLVETMSED